MAFIFHITIYKKFVIAYLSGSFVRFLVLLKAEALSYNCENRVGYMNASLN